MKYVQGGRAFPSRSYRCGASLPAVVWKRSEEHTSELQSRSDLVCRLLLEKKKNNNVFRHKDVTKQTWLPAHHSARPAQHISDEAENTGDCRPPPVARPRHHYVVRQSVSLA